MQTLFTTSHRVEIIGEPLDNGVPSGRTDALTDQSGLFVAGDGGRRGHLEALNLSPGGRDLWHKQPSRLETLRPQGQTIWLLVHLSVATVLCSGGRIYIHINSHWISPNRGTNDALAHRRQAVRLSMLSRLSRIWRFLRGVEDDAEGRPSDSRGQHRCFGPTQYLVPDDSDADKDLRRNKVPPSTATSFEGRSPPFEA